MNIAATLVSRFSSAKGQGLLLRMLYFVYYVSTAAWLPFFSVYLRQVGLSGVQVGLIAGLGPAVQMVSQPLWGLIADLHGRRRTLLVVMLGAALLLPGYAWAHSFCLLAGWATLHGAFTNAVTPLADSLTLDHIEDQRTTSYGAIRCWGAIGWALGALAMGQLLAGRDLRLGFALGAAIMALGWLVSWRGVREVRLTQAHGRHWRGVGRLLSDRHLLAFLLLMVLLQLGSAAVWSFHAVYMSELGAARQLLGAAIAARGLSELPMLLISAAVVRRLGVRPTLALAMAVFGLRELAYSAIRLPGLVVAVEALHGCSFSLLLVGSIAYVHQLVPREWRATGQALLTASLFGVGSLLGNAWAGWLYDRIGVQSMYRINGLWVLGMALLALVVLRPRASLVK